MATRKRSVPSTVFVEPLETRAMLSATPILPLLNNQIVSTIPSNGDVNPYGVTFVPQGFPFGGAIHSGNILVANFNDAANVQGTGSTITRVADNGTTSTFYQGPAGHVLGLDGGLEALTRGFVLVGNAPAGPTAAQPVGQGSILVLNKFGTLVATLTSKTFLDGPWDFSVYEEHGGATAVLFVSNALSGTVDRLTLSVPASGNNVKLTSSVQIGSGFAHGPNAAAFVIGPAGSAYDPANGKLYVSAEGDNAIYAIPNALTTSQGTGKGSLVFTDKTDLHGPLGMILDSNGDLIIANADSVNTNPNHPSELVEFTTSGHLVATHSIDPTEGGAFDIAESFTLGVHRFAYVDDVTNELTIWTLPE
jgi:hypothetical protein